MFVFYRQGSVIVKYLLYVKKDSSLTSSELQANFNNSIPHVGNKRMLGRKYTVQMSDVSGKRNPVILAFSYLIPCGVEL